MGAWPSVILVWARGHDRRNCTQALLQMGPPTPVGLAVGAAPRGLPTSSFPTLVSTSS